MNIFILLALITTVSAHTAGTMGIDFFASRDVNVTLNMGLEDFNMQIKERGSRHISFHPSLFTPNLYHRISIGVLNSNETTHDVRLNLLPGYVEKVVEFENVNITLKVNYKCPSGYAGLRCSIKNVPPTDSIIALKVTANEKKLTAMKVTTTAPDFKIELRESNFLIHFISYYIILPLFMVVMLYVVLIHNPVFVARVNSFFAFYRTHVRDRQEPMVNSVPPPPAYSEIDHDDKGLSEKKITKDAKDDELIEKPFISKETIV